MRRRLRAPRPRGRREAPGLGRGGDVTFYCDDESHVYQPTPEEVAETEAFETCYECEPDDAWEGFKEPRGKALDQFILMRTIPACVPGLPERTLRCGYEPWSGDLEALRIRLSARHR